MRPGQEQASDGAIGDDFRIFHAGAVWRVDLGAETVSGMGALAPSGHAGTHAALSANVWE